jgi:hypothetical protein
MRAGPRRLQSAGDARVERDLWRRWLLSDDDPDADPDGNTDQHSDVDTDAHADGPQYQHADVEPDRESDEYVDPNCDAAEHGDTDTESQTVVHQLRPVADAAGVLQV